MSCLKMILTARGPSGIVATVVGVVAVEFEDDWELDGAGVKQPVSDIAATTSLGQYLG